MSCSFRLSALNVGRVGLFSSASSSKQAQHDLRCFLPASRRTLHRAMASSRGAFIVFEGIDRCGKSTQSSMLVERLKLQNIPVELWRFPDRTCKATGPTINSYLAKDIDLSDEGIHLLFSANRWEKSAEIERKLAAGVTLICDRYAYSGIAYSAAKRRPNMTIEWCKACDAGLPAPDRVLYMQLSPEASAKRGGYGGERYEKVELQNIVASMFEQLKTSNWVSINADQSVESLHEQVFSEVSQVMAAVAAPGCPVGRLWGHDIRVAAMPEGPAENVSSGQGQRSHTAEKLALATENLHVAASVDSNRARDQ